MLFEAAFGNPGFSFSDELKWEGGSSAGATPASQNVSRAAAQRKILKLIRKSDNEEVDRMNVWCVWAAGTYRNIPNLRFDDRSNVELLDGTFADEARIVVGPTNEHSDRWQIKFTVYPSEIFDVDEDVPDLRGEPEINPPGGSHPFSDRDLSQGAGWKWDTSQQIRIRIINNAGLTQGKWPKSNPITNSPSLLSGQPIADSIVLDFPSDPVEGNDDTYGNSNPYLEISTGADSHGVGELVHTDKPGTSISDWGMSQDDTFVERNDWRTFLRLNIGNKWYLVSDYIPWFISLKVKYNSNQLINDGSSRGGSSL